MATASLASRERKAFGKWTEAFRPGVERLPSAASLRAAIALSCTELHLEIERLTDKVGAKFQYIRDLQGDPITDPRLVEVVNAHGAVLGDVVRFLRKLSATVGDLIDEPA
jgi:cysteine sulfinate desulfinase/cysteine desulfurase-like protein